MKTNLFAVLLFLFSSIINVNAQTNLDFETWGPSSLRSNDPTGWLTFNFDNIGFPASTFQETTNPGEGSSSIKMVTTAGYLALLGVDIVGGVANQASPYTDKPTTVQFMYKSNIIAGDTGVFLISLHHWTGTQQIIDAEATVEFSGSPVTNWTTVTIPLTYNTSNTPDTIEITMASSLAIPAPGVGSELQIDAIAIIDTSNNCPNPTSSFTYADNGLGVLYTDASTVTSGTNHTIDVTASGSMDYDFAGDFSGADPNLTVNLGDTLTFNVNAPGHPFWLKTIAGTGSGNAVSVTNNGTSSGTIVWVPTSTGTFFYNCELHSMMTGSITVSPSATSYAWTFGDGNSSTQQSPTHIYSSDGTYTVCLSVTDVCGTDSSCQSVTVADTTTTCNSPVAGFTFSDNGLTVSFLDASTTTGSSTYSWVYGDGNTSTQQSPIHTYSADGSYSVCLTITDSCGTDSICQLVTVTDTVPCLDPVAGFNYVISGLNVTFTDSSKITGNATYDWDFGDTTGIASGINPSYLYTMDGTYTVCLVVTDSCGSDTICQTITVADTSGCAPPVASFTSNAMGLQADFTNTSSSSFTGEIFSENFDSYNAGDYAAISSPHITTWSNTPGSSQDAFIDATLSSSPSNSVYISGPAGGGTIDLLLPFSQNYTSGTYIYSMKYYVVAGNGAYFNLQQSSIPAVGWMMEVFFDGSGNGEVNPSSLTPGFFSYSNNSWTDIMVSIDLDSDVGRLFINGSLVHSYTFSTGALGTGTTKSWGGVNLYSYGGPSTNPAASSFFVDDIWFGTPPTISYNWDFGDGTGSSTAQDPSYIYQTPGTYTVCLTVTDSCGTDSTCQSITVVDSCVNPTANFTYIDNALSVLFTDASTTTGNTTFSWSFGDGNSSTQQTPTHTYSTGGTYNVCLTVSDSCGTDSLCLPVIVGGLPCNMVPMFTATANGLDVTFTNSTTGTVGGFQCTWDFGDGNSTGGCDPNHTFAAAGTYTVCLTIQDFACIDSICQTITVVDSSSCPLPTSAFTYSANELDVAFSDGCTFTGGATYSWDFGDGNSGNTASPNHTYAAAGTYTVCLIVADSCGTDSSCQSVTVTSTVGIGNTLGIPEINIYPNPASNVVNILVSEKLKGTIVLYDLSGKELKQVSIQEKSTSFSVEDMSKGLYLYSIFDTRGIRITNGKLGIEK